MEKHDSADGTREALPRGMIDPLGSAARIKVRRHPPSTRLAPFLDHYWIITWDLTGRAPEEQRVIPAPNAHLVFAPGNTALFGVVRGIEARRLTGQGRAIGARFRTGGLRPFLDEPVAQLTGRRLPAYTLTRVDDGEAERHVLSASDDTAMIAALEALLAPILPAPDPTVEQICAIIAAARRTNGAKRVEALAQEAGLGLRALQRLFHEYVGVSPKWVLRRYRLQETAWLLAQGRDIALAPLAADLGYYDQAHLARDFSKLFGSSPARYRVSQAAEPA